MGRLRAPELDCAPTRMDKIRIMATWHDRMYIHPPTATSASEPSLRLDHATAHDRHHLTNDGRRTPHHHDVYHLVLVVAGAGSFLAEEGPVAVRAPWLFLVSPGRAHSFQAAAGDDTVYSEVTFTGREASGAALRATWPVLLARRYGQACPLPAHGAIDAALAADLDRQIADLVRLGLDRHPAVEGLASGLLDQLLFTVFCRLVAEADRDHDAIERARRLIEARLDQPLALDQLARLVGLSAKHLGRAFARRYGLPPNQYRRRAVIDQAATLLRSTRLPLAEIAARLGYADVHYFNRVFAQVHGEAPGRFRRREVRIAPGDL